MRYFFLFFISLSASIMFFSANCPVDIEPRPVKLVHSWFRSELDQLEELTNQLAESVEVNPEKIEEDYLKLRHPFKRIEFILAHLDPQFFNTSINGAPLPKVMKKVPDFTIIEPHGLQRIEELVYEEERDGDELMEQIAELKKALVVIQERPLEYLLTDPVILESVRYGILRVDMLGVTGFDAPVNSNKSLLEASLSLEGMNEVLKSYQPYIPVDLFQECTSLIEEGIQQLSGTTFDSFDRAHFHKTFIQPLWQKTHEVQAALKVEFPHQRSDVPNPLNYGSEFIFSDNFLDANYFAEYSNLDKETERVELGRLLFFDPVLSKDNQRACGSCHQPEKGFADGLKTPILMNHDGVGERNSPTVLNSVYAEKFFHDMRVDRLAFQMDHVVLNPGEFATNYSEMIAKLQLSDEYRSLFESAYGVEGISKNTINNAVTRYVASLRSYNSPFDRYMRGELDEIDADVVAGYNLFAGKAGCATCHFAPTFAGLVPPSFIESESEVLGVPEAFEEPYALDSDEGRFMNRILKEQAEFYRYSFKTPTVRNVELTAPYMHNGTFKTLEDVVEFYVEGGGQGLGLHVEYQTLPADSLELSDLEKDQLVTFMKALTDTTGLTAKPSRLPAIQGREDLNKRRIGGVY